MRQYAKSWRYRSNGPRYYDRGQCLNAYEVGDVVLKLDSSCRVGQSKKLQPVFRGPLLVEDRLSSSLYRMQDRRS